MENVAGIRMIAVLSENVWELNKREGKAFVTDRKVCAGSFFLMSQSLHSQSNLNKLFRNLKY